MWESLPSRKNERAKQIRQAKEQDYLLATWKHQIALLEWPNNPRPFSGHVALGRVCHDIVIGPRWV